MPADFGYENGEVLYPIPDWLVNNTFLEIPQSPTVPLGGLITDLGGCACPRSKARPGRLMTAILEDDDDEECCSDDVMDVDIEDKSSELDLLGCENHFHSPPSVCEERQAMCTESCPRTDVCGPEWAPLTSPVQLSQGPQYPDRVQRCCVMFVEDPLQQTCHAAPRRLPCASEALQVPSLVNHSSLAPVGPHFGHCRQPG